MQITPTSAEKKQFKAVTQSFLTSLNKKLSGASAILGGSGAKGTWLSGSHDVDIFVLFDFQKYFQKSDTLSEVLLPSLKKAFPKKKIERLHGSRDYFQLSYEGITFEVVPILKISKAEDAVNITDVSPLHAKWVTKQCKNKEEVLLAKQFCKAQGLYGAESYIAGFSGYVLEILIVRYGSFEKLLKACLKWKKKEIIDVAGHYKGKDVLFELNKSKTISPLVVVDPVDSSRNAAAALGDEKVALLKTVAKKYLKNPADSFFVKQEVVKENLKGNVVWLDVVPLKGKRDVVGAKLLKVFVHLSKRLEPFGISKSGWEYGEKSFFYFVLKRDGLPEFDIRKGPPVKMKDAVKQFKKKHKTTFTKSGHVMARIKNTHRSLNSFVNNVCKDEYVVERVKKIGFGNI